MAEAVGDVTEATGKVGDIVVALDACNGPARGRVVVEAKDRKLSKPGALSELDRAMAERSADFAVLVVPTEDELPSKLEPLREYNGDKLVVALDPEQGTLALELGYRLARARVLMKRSDADGIDAGALRDTIERALGRSPTSARSRCSSRARSAASAAPTSSSEAMAERVRGHLQEIDVLVRPPEAEPATAPEDDEDQLAL